MTTNLFAFLGRLETAKISYKLDRVRDDTVMVEVSVPGEQWEVEFFADGSVEVERYISGGEIEDESALDELFARFSDEEPVATHEANGRT